MGDPATGQEQELLLHLVLIASMLQFSVICEHNSRSRVHATPTPTFPGAVSRAQWLLYTHRETHRTYMWNPLGIDFENRGNLSKWGKVYNCSEIQTDLSKKMSPTIHT